MEYREARRFEKNSAYAQDAIWRARRRPSTARSRRRRTAAPRDRPTGGAARRSVGSALRPARCERQSAKHRFGWPCSSNTTATIRFRGQGDYGYAAERYTEPFGNEFQTRGDACLKDDDVRGGRISAC